MLRPLRAVLFIYELVRFAALVGLLAVLGIPGEGTFPWLVCLSPNALFPLMALFIWLKPADYRSFIPLYVAGKFLSVAAFVSWCVFSFRSLLQSLPLLRVEVISALGGAFIISSVDVLGCAGVLALLKRMESSPPRILPAEPAERPANEPAEGGL